MPGIVAPENESGSMAAVNTDIFKPHIPISAPAAAAGGVLMVEQHLHQDHRRNKIRIRILIALFVRGLDHGFGYGFVQFDGNILGPKILGESTGLASFWVLFSILLFGGLFGFAGMVLGVPVFAMIYSILQRLVIRGLRRRGLPVDTEQYIGKTPPLYKKEADISNTTEP